MFTYFFNINCTILDSFYFILFIVADLKLGHQEFVYLPFLFSILKTLVLIYRKYHRFAILMIALTYKLAFLLSIKYKKVQKLGFELLVLFCLNMLTIEPNLFIWYVAPRFYSFIIRLFLEICKKEIIYTRLSHVLLQICLT